MTEPRIAVEWAGDVRVVVLRGEHDLATLDELIAVLEGGADARPTVVDLSDCSLFDSSSLGVLFHACQASPVGRFAVVVPHRSPARRLVDVVAFPQVVPIYDSADEALAAVTATR